jgi:hypothetical protein
MRASGRREQARTPLLLKIAPDLTLGDSTTWSASRAATASTA